MKFLRTPFLQNMSERVLLLNQAVSSFLTPKWSWRIQITDKKVKFYCKAREQVLAASYYYYCSTESNCMLQLFRYLLGRCSLADKLVLPKSSLTEIRNLFLLVSIFFCFLQANSCSRSHHYAQLGNAPLKNIFLAYSAMIMNTLKGFHRPIF